MAGLKPYKRTGDAYDPAADFAEQFTRDKFLAAFLGGNVVDAEHDGIAAFVDVEHGLGRAYQGAVLICASQAMRVACVLPADAAEAGLDIARFVRIDQAVLALGTSRWRVF
jgi:hypothetical protein